MKYLSEILRNKNILQRLKRRMKQNIYIIRKKRFYNGKVERHTERSNKTIRKGSIEI